MPKGVYVRTEWHKKQMRGIFQKWHEVPEEWRVKWAEKNTGRKHTPETIEKIVQHSTGANNPAWKDGKSGYYRRIARKIMGIQGKSGNNKDDLVVHHIDGNITNNKIENLKVMTRHEHGQLHYRQGDIFTD